MPAITRVSSALAMAAALSTAAMPASAADLPTPVARSDVPQTAVWTPGDEIADRHRYRRYRRHRGVDAGDVVAGVLVLGTIAAVASAASRNSRDRYRDRNYRYDRRVDARRSDSSGLDRAVDMCLREIERDVRVDEVRNVARTATGWQVDGVLFNGQDFSCRIGNDGRIDGVDYNAGGTMSRIDAQPVEDRQFSDETYLKAWTDVGASDATPQMRVAYNEPTAAPSSERLPAYPGGPIDEDLYPGDR